jgi:hypothetical protein
VGDGTLSSSAHKSTLKSPKISVTQCNEKIIPPSKFVLFTYYCVNDYIKKHEKGKHVACAGGTRNKYKI